MLTILTLVIAGIMAKQGDLDVARFVFILIIAILGDAILFTLMGMGAVITQ